MNSKATRRIAVAFAASSAFILGGCIPAPFEPQISSPAWSKDDRMDSRLTLRSPVVAACDFEAKGFALSMVIHPSRPDWDKVQKDQLAEQSAQRAQDMLMAFQVMPQYLMETALSDLGNKGKGPIDRKALFEALQRDFSALAQGIEKELGISSKVSIHIQDYPDKNEQCRMAPYLT